MVNHVLVDSTDKSNSEESNIDRAVAALLTGIHQELVYANDKADGE